MSEKNIVICDQEVKYAEKLMENIMERKEFAVKVYVCSTWENVKILSRDKNIHILVIDETCAKKERKGVEAEQIFVLTTGNFQNVSQDEKCVYKYQCVDQILSEILETYFERTKENMMRSVKKESVKMLAVYSPIHRAGKTSFAVAFGKELARCKKVLYLNLEEYFGYLHRQTVEILETSCIIQDRRTVILDFGLECWSGKWMNWIIFRRCR